MLYQEFPNRRNSFKTLLQWECGKFISVCNKPHKESSTQWIWK